MGIETVGARKAMGLVHVSPKNVGCQTHAFHFVGTGLVGIDMGFHFNRSRREIGVVGPSAHVDMGHYALEVF